MPAKNAKRRERISASLKGELTSIRKKGLWRECVALDSAPGPHIVIGGKKYLHLCSNNYLGLATHPAVIEAARKAARDWGTGAGAARLITGTSRPAVELEEALAEFKQAEAALLFSSGYLANLGLIPTLAGKGDLLLCDRLNHASLIDAARLSGATIRTYPHGDVQAAREILRKAPRGVKKLIVTDGVFSMDGDIAPLAQLDEAALEFGAWLIVDDAHGTGVVGPQGRGTCAEISVAGDHVIQIVTLSKALGSQGGAIVGSRSVIDLLVNRARTFIFETAIAPPCVSAAHAALQIIQTDGTRLESLQRNIQILRDGFSRAGFPIPKDSAPIIPLLIGDIRRTLEAFSRLRARGYWVTPIRPPSVEPGKSRLRVTVMAAHEPADLECFVDAFCPRSTQKTRKI